MNAMASCLTAVGKSTPMQYHGIMRQRDGLADRRAPSIRVRLQSRKQRRYLRGGISNQSLKCFSKQANGILTELRLPAPFDGVEQAMIFILSLAPLWSKTSYLKSAAHR